MRTGQVALNLPLFRHQPRRPWKQLGPWGLPSDFAGFWAWYITRHGVFQGKEAAIVSCVPAKSVIGSACYAAGRVVPSSWSAPLAIELRSEVDRGVADVDLATGDVV